MSLRAIILTAWLPLAMGSTTCSKREDPPHCPTKPVVVDRVVETRAAIPPALIEPIDDPTNDQPVVIGKTTVGEATTWAEQRRALVARCQADRAALRGLEIRPKQADDKRKGEP